MNDIAVVIRLCYFPGADEDNRRWRFSFFKEHVLPRIEAQTVPADTWVWVHDRHVKEAKALFEGTSVNVFTVNLGVASRPFAETILRGYPWSAVRGMPRYRYQVLFGSDDLISPQFMEVSLKALDDIRPELALVTHHPLMLDWKTGRMFEMRQWSRRPSPFVMLRQPTRAGRYHFIWDQPHTHLHHVTGPRAWRYLDAGHAVMVVHNYNDGTRFDPTLPEIPRVEWLRERDRIHHPLLLPDLVP